MAVKQSRILASRYNIVTIPASRLSRKLIAGTITKKKLINNTKIKKPALAAKATSVQTYIDKYMAKDEITLTMRIITVKKETPDAPPFLRMVDSRHKYYKDYPGYIERCFSFSDKPFDTSDNLFFICSGLRVYCCECWQLKSYRERSFNSPRLHTSTL